MTGASTWRESGNALSSQSSKYRSTENEECLQKIIKHTGRTSPRIKRFPNPLTAPGEVRITMVQLFHCLTGSTNPTGKASRGPQQVVKTTLNPGPNVPPLKKNTYVTTRLHIGQWRKKSQYISASNTAEQSAGAKIKLQYSKGSLKNPTCPQIN